MARDEVPDTTVLIELIRNPRTLPAFERAIATGRVWLSSIVVAELYAGTRSREDAAVIDRLVAAMEHIERLLIPSLADWLVAGRLIARRIRLFGDLRPRDHLADVLLVVSAGRLSGTIRSANVRHIAPWVQLARAAGLDVILAKGNEP